MRLEVTVGRTFLVIEFLVDLEATAEKQRSENVSTLAHISLMARQSTIDSYNLKSRLHFFLLPNRNFNSSSLSSSPLIRRVFCRLDANVP